MLCVLLRLRETSLFDRWNDTHFKKFIIQSQKKKGKEEHMCLLEKKKKIVPIFFFWSEQAHMAVPFSITYHLSSISNSNVTRQGKKLGIKT